MDRRYKQNTVLNAEIHESFITGGPLDIKTDYVGTNPSLRRPVGVTSCVSTFNDFNLTWIGHGGDV